MALLLTNQPDEPLQPPVGNSAAEQHLLGALLMHAGLLENIPQLSPEHFVEPFHAELFRVMREIHGRGETFTPVTLCHNLPLVRAYGQEGMGSYLAQLMSVGGLQQSYLKHFADEIIKAWRTLEVFRCCKVAMLATADGDQPSEEIASRAITALQRLMSSESTCKLQDEAEVTEAIIEDLKVSADTTSTGLETLDEAMGGGLHAGNSYGFGGRKKMGKTLLASTISYNLNQQHVPHLFICGEMGPKEIHQRNLCRELQIKPFSFRGDYRKDPRFLTRLAEARLKTPRCMFYHNAPGLTFEGLRRIVAVAQQRKGIKGVILDYWQLLGGKGKNKSTSEHLDEVAQWIADYCRQEGLWSIVMAQMNQEGNTRGGEGLRLACDQMYLLDREDPSLPNAWLEMIETRYTGWMDVGDKQNPGLYMSDNGPYFTDLKAGVV